MERIFGGLNIGFWGAFMPLFAEVGKDFSVESIAKHGGLIVLCALACYASTFLAKLTIEYVDRWGKAKDDRIADKSQALEASRNSIRELVTELREERNRMDSFEKLLVDFSNRLETKIDKIVT